MQLFFFFILAKLILVLSLNDGILLFGNRKINAQRGPPLSDLLTSTLLTSMTLTYYLHQHYLVENQRRVTKIPNLVIILIKFEVNQHRHQLNFGVNIIK